jgi:hypothetical protein
VKFMKTRRFMAALGAGAALTMGVVGCMSPSDYVNNEIEKVKEGVNQQVEDFQDQVESAIPTVPTIPPVPSVDPDAPLWDQLPPGGKIIFPGQ